MLRRFDMSAVDAEELQRAAQGALTGPSNPSAPNIGRVQQMLTTPAAGGNVILRDTPLISARFPEPRQWVVTLPQATKQGFNSPWAADFDGGSYSPPTIPPASVFGAPSVPAQASGVTVKLQGNLRWGAGGVSQYARFDLPLFGGSFGITADTFDLDVFVSAPTAQQGMPPALVPVVGAFMVPGQSQDTMPLRWQDVSANLVNGGVNKDWSVKPFAKRVQLLSSTSKIGVTFCALNGNGIVYVLGSVNVFEEQAGEGVNSTIDILPGTAFIRVGIFAGAADAAVTPVWWLGFV